MTERKEVSAHAKVAAAIVEKAKPATVSVASAPSAAVNAQGGSAIKPATVSGTVAATHALAKDLTDITATGSRLRQRREALSLSIEDIAGTLKIPARKIKAIENEQWEVLPSGPYLRGFLRAYAKVLRIDAQELIAEVDSSLMQSRSADTILRMPQSFDTPLPKPSVHATDWLNGRRLIVIGLVLLVLIGLFIWSGTQSFKDLQARLQGPVVATPAASDATAPAPAVSSVPASPGAGTTDPVTSTTLANPAAETAGSAQLDGANNAAVDAAAAATSTTTAAPAAGSLNFDFQGESWVQVRQADGKVLMSKINPVGTHENLDGSPPFELIIGNANQVRLQFRGAAVDLAPHTRDNVARLTLP